MKYKSALVVYVDDKRDDITTNLLLPSVSPIEINLTLDDQACSHEVDIDTAIDAVDLLVVYYKPTMKHNVCIDYAVNKARSKAIKIIVFWLDNDGTSGDLSEGLDNYADSIIATAIGHAEEILTGESVVWQNADGSNFIKRKIPKHTCG